MCVLVSAAAFLFSGCMESRVDPYTEVFCGGKSLDAKCIVVFDGKDNEKYISEQRHSFCLSEPFIEITAREPAGNSGCRLAGADFYVKKPVPDNAGPMILDSLYAKLLLTLVTVGDSGWDQASASANSVKLFGTDYKTFTIKPSLSGDSTGQTGLSVHSVPWAQIKVYANMEKKVIDRVTVKNLKTGAELSGYAYNWRKINYIDKKVPTKIDIISTGNWDLDADTSIQINYLDFEIIQP